MDIEKELADEFNRAIMDELFDEQNATQEERETVTEIIMRGSTPNPWTRPSFLP